MMHRIGNSGGGMTGVSAVHVNIFGPHPVAVFGTDHATAGDSPYGNDRLGGRLLLEGATVVGCSRTELPELPAAADVPGGARRSAQWVCDQGDYHAIDAFVARVVDTYQCEWKTAVTTPEVRQRFRSFVNSDKRDEHIVFVEERGQIRPARPDERAEAIAAAPQA